MRLRRLILGRYGHLSDVVLEFPDSPGLHVVLGANEAGKSTALAAIGDCLFGFPHRTPFGFLHATRDLRIGATLQARDGRQATFFRRKGRKEDLFDDQDQAQPESAIAAFLAGATRERFNRVFGLNGAELRVGGDAILQGHGEVGEAILGAHTGLHGFRAKVEALDAEAGKLFGDRRGRRAFHEAADRFTQARHDVAERRVEPGAWKQARDDLTALEQARVEAASRAAALHAERSRLDRIRRTTPARVAVLRAVEDSQALGVVPDLPADGVEQHRAAVGARDQALRDLDREQTHVTRLDAELGDLAESPPILVLGEAIDALSEDRKHVAIAVRDRETLRLLAAQRAAAMVEEGHGLGLTLDADALAAQVPNALDRENISQVLRRHALLSDRKNAAVDSLGAAESRLAEARAALAALPAVETTGDLRQAIDTVKGFGPLDEQLAEATSAVRAVTGDVVSALAALPLWVQGAVELAAAPVPLDAEIQHVTEMLVAARDSVRTIETRLMEHDRLLGEYAAQALADAAARDLPTAEAIGVARTNRDQAWALIRRAHIDGGAVVSPEEVRALGLKVPLPEGFQGLVEATDRLADRRAAEQERVVAVEQRRAATIRQQALRDADEQLRIGAATRLADADVAWHALWQPCGLVPADPTSMREWMQKRTGVLAEHRRSLDAERRLDAVRGRHAVGLAMLAAVMRGTVQAPGTALTTVLRSAEHVCREREKQEDRLAKAGDAVEAALQEQTKAVRVTARLEADLTAWRESWGPAAQSMSLPADASPDLGATALGLWEAIDKAGRARRDAMDRIDEMTAAIDRFAAETRSVVGRVAPGLAGISPLDAVSSLGRDLADARERARRRQEVEAERGRVVTAIEGLERQRNAALDVLVRLCAQAGAMDDDGLAEMIGRWSRHRALAEQIAQRRAELQGLDDGKGLPELTAEADGIDFDTLPARISAIESELRSINVEELQNQERMAGLKQVLGEMERGRDAAAAAQDMETALADIDDISGRYVTLRMAHVLLRAGIERFRRQQQGPLLGRAGQIFARLTEGRYDRLGVDEQEDGKVVVAACRPDGTECQADRLSEGTRDQLYLALRLAALESDARATEPLPFIGDDLLVNFDDRRAKATIRVLADFASVTQVVLFTHHGHIAQMAEGLGSVHPLAVDVAVL